MSDVNLLCEKLFSEVDGEVVDRFVEFAEAFTDSNIDKLNEILSNGFEFVQFPNKTQTADEFISDVADGSFDCSKVDIMEPTVLFDDDNAASLVGKVRMTAKVNGRELRWISNTVASFERIDGIWYFGKWKC